MASACDGPVARLLVVTALRHHHDLVAQATGCEPAAEDGLGIPVLAARVEQVAAQGEPLVQEVEGGVRLGLPVEAGAEHEHREVAVERREMPVLHDAASGLTAG